MEKKNVVNRALAARKQYIIPIVEQVCLRTGELMEIEGVSYKPDAPGAPAKRHDPAAPVF